MSRNFKFLINLALLLFSANIAFALTCRNDYSGTSGCAGNKTPAGTCETLGYYTDNVENCGHYIYCPFDTNYKRCTKASACDIKCKGFYTCSGDGRTPKGDVKCTCGNVNYYEDCYVTETCYINNDSSGYNSCYESYSDTKLINDNGEFGSHVSEYVALVGERCTTLENKKVYVWADCYSIQNCTRKSILEGLTSCENGSGKSKECKNFASDRVKKYFEKCEGCNTSGNEDINNEYGSCTAYPEGREPDGYYELYEKCTQDDGTIINWYGKCNEIDCDGNKGLAYGFTECSDDEVGSGKSIECGGITFYEKCDKDTCDTTRFSANGGYCNATTGSIPYAYYEVGVKCTKNDGTIVKSYASCTTAKDCAGNKGLAYGFIACGGDKVGSGESIKCGHITFYEKCDEVTPTCTEDSVTYCTATTSPESYTTNGYYLVGEKCTKDDDTIVYWVASCDTERGCIGMKNPVYGMHICSGNYFSVGTVKECGGKVYASDCAVSCKYEQKESDCLGSQTFEPYCMDANHVWYGECK